MSLGHLSHQLLEHPDVNAAIDALDSRSVAVPDLPLAARPAVAAAAISRHEGPALVVVSRADRAETLAAALGEYLPERAVTIWPALDALPYEQLPYDLQTATERVALLDSLRATPAGAPAPVIVTPAHGLLQLLMPPADLAGATRVLRAGVRQTQDELIRWAAEHGYQLAPLVYEPGQLARRGGIVDIFPPEADAPLRIDFFGDEIDSIRSFDPHSQRSRERLRTVRLLPPSELALWRLPEAAAALRGLDDTDLRPEVRTEWRRMLEQMAMGQVPASVDLFAPYLADSAAGLLDYLPANTRIVIDEPAAIKLIASQLEQQARELCDAFVANNELPVGLASPIASWQTVSAHLRKHHALLCGSDEATTGAAEIVLDIVDAPRFAGRLPEVVAAVRDRLDDGWRVTIATDQVDRLTELFESSDIFPMRDRRRERHQLPSLLPPGTLEIRNSDIDSGWQSPECKLLLLADLELFGFRKQTRRAHRRRHGEAAPLASALSSVMAWLTSRSRAYVSARSTERAIQYRESATRASISGPVPSCPCCRPPARSSRPATRPPGPRG